MTIIPYKIAITKDLFTSRGGLLVIAQLMDSLKFLEYIDFYFPQSRSNRAYKPSDFIKIFILMQHEGSFHLDDVRHIHADTALRTVLGLDHIPKATSIGDWLRRMGKQENIEEAWRAINKRLLQSTLHHCKVVTLDIDATEIVAHKSGAKWTYKKNKGYMPMVGHIAQTGQVVAIDFREGNVSPAQDNLGFIKQCQQSLPDGCRVGALRIDAAGYQAKIIQYCDELGIQYAIRAKSSAAMRAQIAVLKESDWQPLRDKEGWAVSGEDTCRLSFCIGDYENAFTLIIQRKAITGQTCLDLDSDEAVEEFNRGGYLYRSIATNRDDLTDSEVIHWYNQRGEDSEN